MYYNILQSIQFVKSLFSVRKIIGRRKTYSHFKEAWLANVTEERREKIKTEKNSLTLEFGKKKIVTCEIVFG